jgi:hypothetical protein
MTGNLRTNAEHFTHATSFCWIVLYAKTNKNKADVPIINNLQAPTTGPS